MNDANKRALTRLVRDLERSHGDAAALCEAVRWGLTEEVYRLLERGVDVNARTEDRGTPLMYATNCRMATLLIQRGADVNARDNEGRTPLIWSLLGLKREGDAAAFIRTLVQAGADINAQGPDGTSALTLAKSKYGTRVTKWLEAGRNP